MTIGLPSVADPRPRSVPLPGIAGAILLVALAAALAPPAQSTTISVDFTYRTHMPGGTTCKLQGGNVYAMGAGSSYTVTRTVSLPISTVGVTMTSSYDVTMVNHGNEAQVYCASSAKWTVSNGIWNCAMTEPVADAAAGCTYFATPRAGGGCSFELTATPR